MTATDKLTADDVSADDLATSELCLTPPLRQALDCLNEAIHAVNCVQTTSRFLDSFSELNAQSLSVQIAVDKVAKFSRAQEETAARKVQIAQETFKALSKEDQSDLMGFYGEDILVYLEITIPPDFSHSPSKAVNDLQVLLFDVENLHRALARVRGVEANMTDIFLKLPSIQTLMRKNRDEELRLLGLRTTAEDMLCEKFLALDRGEKDLLWLWYEEPLRSIGIQRNQDAKNPYLIAR